MTDQTITPADEQVREVSLNDCPPGLFWFGQTLGFKSEYLTTLENPRRYQCDAYVVESGEYFWGGAKGSDERGKLLVRPVTRSSPVVDGLADALAAAYTAGATAVHEWWAAGNVEREADFGEAASDYARSIDLTALAMRPAPETTASDDVVEPWGYGWFELGGTKRASGYLPTINYPRSEDISEGPFPLYRANLPKPTEQATSPAPDAVLREAIDWLHRNADGLKSDVALAHRSRGNGCTEWMREDDRDFRRDLDKHLAALASSNTPAPDAVLREALSKAEAMADAFERFNDAEHNRQDCPECWNEGNWTECPLCADRVGDLLNDHLLAINAFRKALASSKPTGCEGDSAVEVERERCARIADEIAEAERAKAREYRRPRGGFSTFERVHNHRANAADDIAAAIRKGNSNHV